MTRLLSPILRGGLLCAFAFGATACSDAGGFGSLGNGQGTLKPDDSTQQENDQFKMEAEDTTGTAGAQGDAIKLDKKVAGFHVLKDDSSKQMAVYNKCNKSADGMMQCVVFDGDKADAKMIGLEYIIAKDKFDALSDEEKKLWHPHNFEILSGQIVVPGMSDEEELAFMTEMMNSYGKSFHFMSEGDDLPKDEPKLAWSITKEGELKEELLTERDQKLGIDTKKKAEARQSLQAMAQDADSAARGVMGEDVKGQSSMDQSQQQTTDETEQPVKGDETAAPVKGEQDDTADETAAPVKGEQDETAGETAAPVKGEQDETAGETAAPVKGEQDETAGETVAPVKGQQDAAPTQDSSVQDSNVKDEAPVKSAK